MESVEVFTPQSKLTPSRVYKLPRSLARSQPKLQNDKLLLNKLISSINSLQNTKEFLRVENLLTKLKQRLLLNYLNSDLLLELTYKINSQLKKVSFDFTKSAVDLSKDLLKALEPSRVYLNLAGTPGIDSRVLMDETLESIMDILKNSCEKVILVSAKQNSKAFKSSVFKELLASVCAVLEYLAELIQRGILQDSWFATTSDLLLKLIFCKETEMVKMAATCALGAIYSCFPKLSNYIIEEIVNNLPLLTYNPDQVLSSKAKKLNGTAYLVSEEVCMNFSSFLVIYITQSYSTLEKPLRLEGKVDLQRAVSLYQETIKLAEELMTQILSCCVKSQSDSQDYRVFLDSFIEDLLKVKYYPQFPLCGLFLSSIVLQLFALLTKNTYSVSVRNFAIDKLSHIAQSLREDIKQVREYPLYPHSIFQVSKTNNPFEDPLTSKCVCNKGSKPKYGAMLQCFSCYRWFHEKCVDAQEEDWTCDNCKVTEAAKETLTQLERTGQSVLVTQEIDELTHRYQESFKHLVCNFLVSENKMFASARSILISEWSSEALENKEFLETLWLTPNTSEVKKLSEKGTLKLNRQLRINQDLGSVFYHILNKILGLLGANQPLIRARALKGLSGIVESDPQILEENAIEEAITARLMDSAISVRESCVELIGKFINKYGNFKGTFYDALIKRLKDKGPSVRKRVIKILKDIALKDPSHERMTLILSELLKRIADDTEGIKDVVIRTFHHIWFSGDKSPLDTITKMLHVVSQDEYFVQVFQEILKSYPNERKGLVALADQASRTLFESRSLGLRIVQARLLEVIARTDASATATHISTISHFLTPTLHSVEETNLIIHICNIIHKTARYLSGKYSSRYSKVEKSLLNLVYTHGSQVMSRALAALCNTIKHITNNQALVLKLIKNCFALISSQSRVQVLEEPKIPSLKRAMLILSLTVKYYDVNIYLNFQLEPSKSFQDSLFEVFKNYYQITPLKEVALESLSYLWVRFPQLLLKSEFLVRNAWKETKETSAKLQLLGIFQEFLEHCDTQLVQSSEDFGNILGAMQSYIHYIMDLTKDPDTAVREITAEVLKLVQTQGQLNPNLLIPKLIAQLADTSLYVREVAFSCLENIHNKNSDLIIVGLSGALYEMYDFQLRILKGTKTAFEESLLGRLYGLIKQKKSQRNKFLNCVCRLLEPSADPGFTCFVAELLSGLQYTSHEELSIVLNYLHSKIETSAYKLLRLIKLSLENKEVFPHEDTIEAILTAQLVVLKNYLINLYQVKPGESKQDKPVHPQPEDTQSFKQLYTDFESFHCLERVQGEQLKDFKKKFKNHLESPTVLKKRPVSRSEAVELLISKAMLL